MGIKYEDIKQANDSIKTTTISRTDKKTGKTVAREYAEVNQRIKAFRMVYPEGFIKTEMVSNEGGVCIFRAMVGYEQENGLLKVIGTGTAYEKETSSFINQTSYIENCETSAVGRALGMAGFGIDTSVASLEKVQNAMANQKEPKEEPKGDRKATPKQVECLAKIYTGKNLDKLLKSAGIEKLDDLPMKTASDLIAKIQGGKKNE